MRMLVTVIPCLAASFWTASQSSSDTRIVRVGVLGALGLHLVYHVVLTLYKETPAFLRGPLLLLDFDDFWLLLVRYVFDEFDR